MNKHAYHVVYTSNLVETQVCLNNISDIKGTVYIKLTYKISSIISYDSKVR